MSKVITPTPEPVVNPVPDPPTETGGIPKARLDEVIGERNDLRNSVSAMQTQLDEFKTAQEEADKAKRIKAGEAETMVAELEAKLGTYKTQAEGFQKAQAERLDTLRNKLPEDKRDKYAHVTDLGLMESLVDDLTITGGGAPPDRSAVPKEDFGGYGSFTEWANKDMKSFSAYMAKENEQSIKWGVVPE